MGQQPGPPASRRGRAGVRAEGPPARRDRFERPNLRIRTERPTVVGVPVYTFEEMVAEMDRFGPENEAERVDWEPDRGSEIIDDDDSFGVITLEDVLDGRSAQRG